MFQVHPAWLQDTVDAQEPEDEERCPSFQRLHSHTHQAVVRWADYQAG